MKRTIWLWVLALLITAFVGRHQRVSGPTWPVSGEVALENVRFAYVLDRTHAGPGDHPVRLEPGDPMVSGVLRWKRLGTDTDWNDTPMAHQGEALVGSLPHQKPGGKIAYQITLLHGDRQQNIPAEPAVLRFRSEVPGIVLIPHIIFMFAAMLLSTRAALEVFNPEPRWRLLTDWTLVLLFVGGFLLGPLVSLNAFGEPWTGFPVSNDVTDNKTLIALIGWLAAAWVVRKTHAARVWVPVAGLLMLVTFIIPHSVSAEWVAGKAKKLESAPALEGELRSLPAPTDAPAGDTPADTTVGG